MEISAVITNSAGAHRAIVRTGSAQQDLSIPAKPGGAGSGVNGGEPLFLALATCYCNDIYREAHERGLTVDSVQVEVTGNFSTRGAAAEDIRYRATVRSSAGREEILALMRHTDSVAEIHDTVRQGAAVALTECVAECSSE
jgi:organic hydroperoxide reductase OsmC/OhrA